MSRALCIALILTLTAGGCGSGSSPDDSTAAQPRLRNDERPRSGVDRLPPDPGPDVIDEDPTRPKEPIAIGGYQPRIDLAIEVMESMPEQYAAAWEVLVNTGGWTIQTDRVEHEGGVLRVYVTLEKPGPDEIVTQALETLRGRHATGTDVVERAELYVRGRVRGTEDSRAEHVLVAVAP